MGGIEAEDGSGGGVGGKMAGGAGEGDAPPAGEGETDPRFRCCFSSRAAFAALRWAVLVNLAGSDTLTYHTSHNASKHARTEEQSMKKRK